MERNFDGKVVWITGASSGIGEALAYRFAKRGARVVLSSNDEPELNRVVSKCEGTDDTLMALPLDLTDFGSFDAKVRTVLDRFGAVDILVNNAGISHRSAVKDTSLEVFKRVMDIDFMGHAELTRAVLPSMLERRAGHIVVTSSLAGIMYFPTRAAYCAAKHAVQGYFNALRTEVWKDGIQVTLICPAGVRTNIGYSSLMGDGSKHGKSDRHIETGMTPDECADRIMKAVIKRKELVYIGKPMQKLPVYIALFAPSLFSWLVKRVKSLG